MAQITVSPRVMKNISVEIDGNNYEAAIASMKLTPQSSMQTWKGGTPAAVFTEATNPTWVCDMKIAQEYTGGALALFLLQHAGERKSCTFKPTGSGGVAFTATLIIAAPEIGGDIDSWMEATIQHGIDGQPSITQPSGS